MLFTKLIYLCTIFFKFQFSSSVSISYKQHKSRISFINTPNRSFLFNRHLKTHNNVTLSGIQPSGELHIGNYIGCIQPCLTYQSNNNDLHMMIADNHALSGYNFGDNLRENTRKTIALTLACGIDPNKTTIFAQSHFPQILEMNWILGSFIKTSKFYKLAQFRNRGVDSADMSIAKFLYPLLMASDILALNARLVIAGPDQKINLSLARYSARKLNRIIGSDTFIVPEPVYSHTYRVKSLSDGRKKMSKTGSSNMDVINLLDSEDMIYRKIRSAKTQSSDDDASPELNNLLALYSIFSGRPYDDVVDHCDMSNFLKLKTDLASHIIDFLSPIKRYLHSITAHPLTYF
ncbi:tryptophanyl-tRNA synthetase [Theileria orientalis strain Shintoku]|uniref:tryptophan--tRNA ligase n=1 Tax=Theileria orientalis strain Shintoku TaxID=869250 RepID=J4DA46_THEOR|nr:tryptophanyl-tRNA synthetase [Theileria orientalis strain Shintoku]BAM41770.1 tryptophanyl-tRNA synthetase [Theileria orientalis strain Shintoku]|eukprot:XP_009692071.1 tryptophanyl-tRNA synthetase [Theileria orientalis strain Shintoku]